LGCCWQKVQHLTGHHAYFQVLGWNWFGVFCLLALMGQASLKYYLSNSVADNDKGTNLYLFYNYKTSVRANALTANLCLGHEQWGDYKLVLVLGYRRNMQKLPPEEPISRGSDGSNVDRSSGKMDWISKCQLLHEC
jgi:hypothetical protein